MATKGNKDGKKRSLSYSVPAKDNNLYLRSLDATAAIMFPSEDETHGPRSKLINFLIFKLFKEKGLVDDFKKFNEKAIEKLEKEVQEYKSQPKIKS